MAQQSITITFPPHIPKERVVRIMEGAIKNGSSYEVQCHFKEFDGKENVYLLWSEDKEAFYLAGITAAGILEKHNS